MASIEDSYIYQTFNASNALIQRIVKYIKTSTKLDSSYFEEQYMQMKRTSLSPLTKHVIEALDNGDIELLYSRESKIGTSIPFIIRKNESGRIVATIFISTFAVIDKNNNLNIPIKQIYALLESAYVALQLQVNPTYIQRNTTLMKITAYTYTEMVMRILNKDYALSLDKQLYDKVTYSVMKFYLSNIWKHQNREVIESYSSHGLKYITDLDLNLVRTAYDDCDIKTIDDLLKFIKTLSPRMAELNTRFFIERYVNTYHGSTILSIDYLPYIFFVIINIILGSFLISQTALNDVIKNIDGINRFYVELSKLI